MTVEELEQKIRALDYWLKTNPHHDNYSLVLQDKQQLEQQLKTLENE